MALIVPDASIILKWVLAGEEEPAQAAAREIQGRWLSDVDQIILPTLWVYEVGNVLGAKRPEHAGSLMALLLDYEFDVGDVTPESSQTALTIMAQCQVSFYDAAYHALAIIRDAVFITADKKYFNKARGQGYIELLPGI